jgi:hypothetical protein
MNATHLYRHSRRSSDRRADQLAIMCAIVPTAIRRFRHSRARARYNCAPRARSPSRARERIPVGVRSRPRRRAHAHDTVDTIFDRAHLVHYLDTLLRHPHNSAVKLVPPPRLPRRWVVLATTAAMDHAFYLPIVARVSTRPHRAGAASGDCADWALGQAWAAGGTVYSSTVRARRCRQAQPLGGRLLVRRRGRLLVRRRGSDSGSIRSCRSCRRTAGTRPSPPRPSSR